MHSGLLIWFFFCFVFKVYLTMDSFLLGISYGTQWSERALLGKLLSLRLGIGKAMKAKELPQTLFAHL